jgi:hypothetical protein
LRAVDPPIRAGEGLMLMAVDDQVDAVPERGVQELGGI